MLQNTYTTDDLVERIGLMKKYYNRVLFEEDKEATLVNVLQDDCDENTLACLQAWMQKFEKQKLQPIVVYEALDTVQEDLSGMPNITMYVPVRFTSEQVKSFGNWFRDNVQPNLLMTLRIDPRATGGCGFIWNDTYYDFSLRYYIDKNQEEITTMFNKHTHV